MSTEETNATEVCENCGKDIESYKMFLHERYCKINIRKCSICKEPVQVDEYNEHKIMKHKKEKCESCGQSFLMAELKTHQCSKKMVECKYCGLYMDLNELNEHEYQCGSKSEPCEYCGVNVPMMEKELHLQYTCSVKATFDKNDRNPPPQIESNNNDEINNKNENNKDKTKKEKKTKNKNNNINNKDKEKTTNNKGNKKNTNKGKNAKNKKDLENIENEALNEEENNDNNKNKMDANPPPEQKKGTGKNKRNGERKSWI